MFNRKTGLIIAGILIVFGLVGALNILIHGEHAMGTNNKVPWGAMIAGYVFFVGASAGLSIVSSLGHVFKIERFEVIGKRALVGGIATLLMGFVVIALELGKPFNMIYILFSPGISSAIFWMGALYGTLLVLLLAEFYFVIKGKHAIASTIGIFVVIADVAAHSNLGAVFGNSVARSFWNGPFIPIYLIVLAILLGLGVLAVMFYIIDKTNATKDSLVYRNEHIVSIIGKLMALFIVISFFFMFWKLFTSTYGAAPGQYEAAMALLAGPLSFNFWVFDVLLMMVIPFILLMTKNGFQPQRVFLAGILTIIGNLFVRIDLVFAGEIVEFTFLPGQESQYLHAFVSWSEWGVLLGAIGGSILIYLLAEKYFNLDEEHEHHHGESKANKPVEA